MTAMEPGSSVVCELPGWTLVPGFRWYEIGLDEAASLGDPRVAPAAPGARIIGATHTRSRVESFDRVRRALAARFSHVLFEIVDDASAAEAVRIVRGAGAASIATVHLDDCPSLSDLRDVLRRIRDADPDIVKVAFPARTSAEVAVALHALHWAQAHVDRPVSVTPMGTRWGRVAAGAAGSALVFAPHAATYGRNSASDVRDMLRALAHRG